MSQILSLLFVFSLHVKAQAQETTTLIAIEEPSPNYETTVRSASFQSTSKIIIDEKAIKDSKAPNIATLLATQANINVASTNTQPSTIFLRGGDSSHLLILIDGLPFYDASTAQKTVNLNTLDVKTIRRIEILKGPQSVLYGGQALTGVIKIETFPLDLKDKASAVIEGGNFQYAKASVTGLKANEAQDIAGFARAYWSQKMTLSPIKGSDWKYPNYLNGGDLAFISRGDFTSFVKVSQTNEKNDLQNSNPTTFAPIDTDDYKFKNRASSLSAGLSVPQMLMRPRLLLGHQASVRTYELAPSTNQYYGSALTNVRVEAEPIGNEFSNLLVGLSYQKEGFIFRNSGVESSNNFNEHRGVFAKWAHDFGSLLGYEAGLRSDFINHQDRVDSLQLGLTMLEKLKFEYATGFKTASLFQLFGSYGNKDLQPERARTYSLTYENIQDDQNFSVTLFDTYFDGLITTTGSFPTLKYNNVSRAQTRGVESAYSVTHADRLRGSVNLGYQEPRDVTNAKWLARRPLVTASLGLSKEWEKDSVGAEIVYTGDRTDRATATTDRQLASRTLLNLNYTYNLSSQFSVYTRANNVTDQRFEQTSGYYDEGFFGLVGLEFQN